MSNNGKISIPEKVKRGFAEYGANFFAIYDYTGRTEDDYIYCLSERPFSMKLTTRWADTPKTSIAKKLNTITGKFGAIAQVVAGKDYDVVLAGNTTYVKYTGVERIQYSTQTTVLDSTYQRREAMANLSGIRDIERFLMQHGLPKVNENSFGQMAENILNLPVDTVDKIVNISDNITASQENLDVAGVNSLLNIIKRISSKIQETVNKKVETLNTVFQQENEKSKVLERERKIVSGGLIPKTTGNFRISSHDDGDKIDIFLTNIETSGIPVTSGITICTIYHYYKTIEKFTYDANDETENIPVNKIQDFYREKFKDANKLIEVEQDWEDKITKAVNDDDKKVETSRLKTELKTIIEEVKTSRESEERAETVTTRDYEKLSSSKSNINRIADSLLNLGTNDSIYGKFDHRISPCILYYSLAGKIFRDHVLITSWSESQNIWGFNCTFDITMEKAEIDTYSDFIKYRSF